MEKKKLIEDALNMLDSNEDELLDTDEWNNMHNRLIENDIDVSYYSLIAKPQLQKRYFDIVYGQNMEKVKKERDKVQKKDREDMRKVYKEYLNDMCKDGLDEIRRSKNFKGTKEEIKTLLEGMELGINNQAMFPSLHGTGENISRSINMDSFTKG